VLSLARTTHPVSLRPYGHSLDSRLCGPPLHSTIHTTLIPSFMKARQERWLRSSRPKKHRPYHRRATFWPSIPPAGSARLGVRGQVCSQEEAETRLSALCTVFSAGSECAFESRFRLRNSILLTILHTTLL